MALEKVEIREKWMSQDVWESMKMEGGNFRQKVLRDHLNVCTMILHPFNFCSAITKDYNGAQI